MKIPFINLPKQAEKRNPIVGVMIGVMVALVVSLIYSDLMKNLRVVGSLYELVQNLEYKSYDTRFKIRGPLDKKYISQDIVLLDYDDESQKWNPFPPDRTYYSDIINAIGKKGAGADAMFFDIFFVDPFGRRYKPEQKELFLNNFEEVSNYIDNNLREATVKDLTKISEAMMELEESGNKAEAGKILDNIVTNPQTKDLKEEIIETAGIIDRNKDLHLIAPDWDTVLRQAITDAQNVYLAQTVEEKEATKYTVDDVLFNKKIHDKFAEMIIRLDRTQTKNKLELEVNTMISNMMAYEYDRILKESKKGGRALPFTKEQYAAIQAEAKSIRDQTNAALGLNQRFAFTIGKKAPMSRKKLHKTIHTLRKISPLNKYIVENSAGLGYVKPELQRDGVIRMAAPVFFFKERLYPHISLMLIMRYLDVPTENVDFYNDRIVIKKAKYPNSAKTRNLTIPFYKGRNFLVNWAGRYNEPEQFHHRSFRVIYDKSVKYNLIKKEDELNELKRAIVEAEADEKTDEKALEKLYKDLDVKESELTDSQREVLNAMSPREREEIINDIDFFEGKIVLTGLTAAGTHDLNPIPFHERYPLVGMHANLVNTALKRIFIRTTPFGYFFLMIIVLGAALGYVGGAAKQFPGAMATLGAIAGYTAICIVAFNVARIWLPYVPIVLTLVFVYLIVLVYRFMTEGQEAKKMKSMFSTYVTPSLVETLIQNPDMLKLGGERMELTAMFALASGPGLETDDAEELVDRLNEYFTAMTEQIFKYDGTLDKYEGHIIMAVYGAPVHFDDHAVKACLSCVGMKQALKELWTKWEQEGKGIIKTTVGLNSGPMIAGNMGSQSRFNYTIMGDSVNLSARILGAANQYGVDYMISSMTYEAARDQVIARLVDDIVVVGKTEPIKVYQVMGSPETPPDPETAKCIEYYEKGFELYTQRRWDDAMDSFRAALEHVPDDGPSKVLLARCEEYKASPPDDSWQGEFKLTKKGV